MVLCLNVQIVKILRKLRLLPPDQVSEAFEQVRVVQVTLGHISYQFYVDDKIRPFN